MGIQPSTLTQASKNPSPASQSTDATPPKVDHVSTETKDEIVTVKVKTSDIGGTVAGVEVSLNNGKRWHPIERAWEVKIGSSCMVWRSIRSFSFLTISRS